MALVEQPAEYSAAPNCRSGQQDDVRIVVRGSQIEAVGVIQCPAFGGASTVAPSERYAIRAPQPAAEVEDGTAWPR